MPYSSIFRNASHVSSIISLCFQSNLSCRNSLVEFTFLLILARIYPRTGWNFFRDWKKNLAWPMSALAPTLNSKGAPLPTFLTKWVPKNRNTKTLRPNLPLIMMMKGPQCIQPKKAISPIKKVNKPRLNLYRTSSRTNLTLKNQQDHSFCPPELDKKKRSSSSSLLVLKVSKAILTISLPSFQRLLT